MIGWIGNIFLLAGVYYIGNKQKVGFLLTAFGEIIWIAYSVTISLWSLVAACVLFFGMSLRNWYKWYKDDKAEEVLANWNAEKWWREGNSWRLSEAFSVPVLEEEKPFLTEEILDQAIEDINKFIRPRDEVLKDGSDKIKLDVNSVNSDPAKGVEVYVGVKDES